MPIQLSVSSSFLMVPNFVDIWTAEWLSNQEKQKTHIKIQITYHPNILFETLFNMMNI